MDQSQRQFLAETEDLIEQIFADLDELREKASDRRARRELVDRIFRRIHRIKGSAASLGLEGLSGIAHEFENLLGAIRTGRVVVENEILDTCESATIALLESLHLASSGVIEPSRRALFERIQILAQGNSGKAVSGIGSVLDKLPLEIWQSLTGDEKLRLEKAVEEGDDLYVVTTSFDIAGFDAEFSRLKEKLAARGEVIATSPMIDPERADRINFKILFAGKSDLDVADPDLTGFAGLGIRKVFGKTETPVLGDQGDSVSLSAKPSQSLGATSLIAGLRRTPATALTNFIRTDLDDLDRLISSTHDLFRATAKALELALAQPYGIAGVKEELERLDVQIRRSFLSVEDKLIGLRMVSLAPVLQRAARAGRAAARLSNKEIDFEVVGSNLKLDKLLSDAIADPLIQLVRNAVDHGIEASEQASRDEKKRGLVRIEVTNEGRQTCLRVTDNGRGIDPDIVSKAAINLGVIRSDTRLDMDHSVRMIFRPGFTTLTSASTISGRGVGLDVVETAVEQVGGELRVSSQSGRGSTFEIRLPATFGLLRSTRVASGGSSFCIDSDHVVKIEVIAASQLEKREDKEILRSASGVVPVFHLRQLLGQPADEPTDLMHVITCEFPEQDSRDGHHRKERAGVVVDKVVGSEEVLVRNLGRHSSRWPGIAGATELRDGTVGLVLDLRRLIQGVVTDN